MKNSELKKFKLSLLFDLASLEKSLGIHSDLLKVIIKPVGIFGEKQSSLSLQRKADEQGDTQQDDQQNYGKKERMSFEEEDQEEN